MSIYQKYISCRVIRHNSEVRSQKSEVRSQKSEDLNPLIFFGELLIIFTLFQVPLNDYDDIVR